MICPNCQQPIEPGQKFCPNCGFKIYNEPADQQQSRTRRRQEEPSPQKQTINVYSNYAKNNPLLLLLGIIIIGLLGWWKLVVGGIAFALFVLMYYLRAGATNGGKEGLETRISNAGKKSIIVDENGEVQQVARKPKFLRLSNVVVLMISSLVTLGASFVGNFIRIDASTTNFDTATPMTMYDALNLGGVAAKLTNALGLQFDLQGLLLIGFYILILIPILVIALTFLGGRFMRTLLSFLLFAIYTSSLIFIYYETSRLKQLGFSLGLTPGIMFFVIILSTFVMTVYSSKVKRS